jgi:transcription antitermination factor NusG
MELCGAGDRWLAGEPVDGVTFAQGDAVEVLAGPYAGELGAIVLLLGLRPEPIYLVKLGTTGRDMRVRQSALRAVES